MPTSRSAPRPECVCYKSGTPPSRIARAGFSAADTRAVALGAEARSRTTPFFWAILLVWLSCHSAPLIKRGLFGNTGMFTDKG